MKNQYFGDVNDYRKYGLLRALLSPGELSLSVGWMLTPDDGSTDGGRRRYLQQPDRWRRYDPSLFDHLSATLSSEGVPSVALIESAAILPRATFFSELVPDGRDVRRGWRDRLAESARGADLVFLDPDNGLQIPSKPIGSRGSSKHAAWDEVERLWDAGSSVLVYQHFCRERRDHFTARLAEELRERTGAPFIEAFCTAHVVFLLAAQQRHAPVFETAIASHLPRWAGQIAVAGLAAGQCADEQACSIRPRAACVKHGLDPIADFRSRVLILGSLPGDESISKGEYYSCDSNQFWRILGAVFGRSAPQEPEERIAFLVDRGIALWDVLAGASRQGSSDAAIEEGTANDIVGFLQEHPAISVIAFNGSAARQLFNRHMQLQAAEFVRLQLLDLPSSSSTPGRHVKSFEDKVGLWSVLADHTLQPPVQARPRELPIARFRPPLRVSSPTRWGRPRPVARRAAPRVDRATCADPIASCLRGSNTLLCDNETEARVVEHDQVALFLMQLRQCAKCSFRFERRPENMATLARLGMTVAEARERILALKPADYVEGPKPRSENSSQDAWVFGLHIQGVDVYVKVSIRLEPARCLCVSFHEADWPMELPYRNDPRRGSDR